MPDVYDDTYWADKFGVTTADLDRIAAHIRETGQAHDLTALAQRVVRGRLRHGPETSAPAQPTWAEDRSVRLWDPLEEGGVGRRGLGDCPGVRNRKAGAFCKIIRAIRRVQGREADFERYYQGLFATYRRFSALKDELRKAIEGPAHRRKS